MKVKEVIDYIEALAPLSYAEDFDNVGLLVGAYDTKVTGILVTLDTLEETVEEAIAKKCNLIVSFHPILFKGLKKLTGATYVERTVRKAVKNDIAIYASHTALDNSSRGVSAKICDVIGLENPRVLLPKKGRIKKLTTYVPSKDIEAVRTSLFAAGAGNIGKYDTCSFSGKGVGTFRGKENANPTIGKRGVLETCEETFLSVIFEAPLEKKVLRHLHQTHPYEEVAYEVHTLDNKHPNIGMGMVGTLPKEMEERDFLTLVKKKMKASCIRHSEFLNKPIKRVAVLGGSGSFAIEKAIGANADAYISADFKYHDFFTAEKKILLADIGHYESEQFTKNLFVEYLTKKITNFAVVLSEKNTNPIYYS